MNTELTAARPMRTVRATAGSPAVRTVPAMSTEPDQDSAPDVEDVAGIPAWQRVAAPTIRIAGFHTELKPPPNELRYNCGLAVEAARLALMRTPSAPLLAQGEAVKEIGRGRLHRTQKNQVASFTSALMLRLPGGARLADAELEWAVAHAHAATRTQLASTRLGLFVRNPNGSIWAFRVHPAYRLDAVSDGWIAQLTGLDGQVGAVMPQFAGTVVVTPRAQIPGIHRDTRSVHRLGECLTCPMPARRTIGGW